MGETAALLPSTTELIVKGADMRGKGGKTINYQL